MAPRVFHPQHPVHLQTLLILPTEYIWDFPLLSTYSLINLVQATITSHLDSYNTLINLLLLIFSKYFLPSSQSGLSSPSVAGLTLNVVYSPTYLTAQVGLPLPPSLASHPSPSPAPARGLAQGLACASFSLAPGLHTMLSPLPTKLFPSPNPLLFS